MKKRPAKQWARLDNAAKLYASVSNKRDPKVFRFACELNELVQPLVLQQALNRTLVAFPLFRSVLRRGLFWYFLEQSDRPALVVPEQRPPCSPLRDRSRLGLLFTVSYFRCRINLEVYHVLTDGTGALQFVRRLVYEYLLICHKEQLGDHLPQLDYDASETQKSDDSFQKYYAGTAMPAPDPQQAAAHLNGLRLPEYRSRVIEGELSVKDALQLVRENNATLTAYICAQLICAIHAELPVREHKKPIVLTVPVNLRNYFDSASARNFFSVFHVRYTFGQGDDSIAGVLAAVTRCFAEELTQEKLMRQMNRMAAMEHSLVSRALPLFLKDIGLTIGSFFSTRGVTCAVSNLGRVTMPEPLMPYIRNFDVFMSTNRMQLCACSFADRLMISITAPFVSTDVQKRFFRAFSRHIPVTIHSNLLETQRDE